MKDLAERALNVAALRGAGYADVRVVERRQEQLQVRNGRLEALAQREDAGFGVRVLADGAWGFAASARLTAADVERVAALAVQIARASARVRTEGVQLGAPFVARGQYRTPMAQDPFARPLDEKVALLLAADAAMRQVPGVTVTRASAEFIRERKLFASSEGSLVEQEIIESGAGLEAIAVQGDEIQQRSYPNSFGRQQGTAGYEYVEAMDLVGNAPRVAEQAVQLLSAKPCPPDQLATVILDATQVALQVHESCGHAVELDRVFGEEASYAGTSFLTVDTLGALRYGSQHVTITADATLPTGLGTFGYDDEGVPAQRVALVEQGRFVGYLTSRETAARLGQRSNGCMRADSWAHLPLIRMTNINLELGDWRLADLIADTDDGLYMETNRSWSIDDRRLSFQFGTEIAWEIRGGKLGAMVKNATYAGVTPRFWASCDAVCGRDDWHVWGVTNCGKGQPPQVAHVGHGAAPARFRNVRVGLLR
ncbi:MAG: TldD/PmbA family protein [Chloroflexi bacterium]|nr:TldD/PmbA family protein [Chloroflexota bacterium]